MKNIRYIGKDYSRIDASLIYVDDVRIEDDRNLYLEILESLIREVQKDIDSSDIVVNIPSERFNTAESSLSGNVLYSGKNRRICNGDYYAGLVGIVRKVFKYRSRNSEDEYDITLQISSRFDEDAKKPYFLSTLLLRDDINFTGNSILEGDEWTDLLLLFWLRNQLIDSVGKGAYKVYRYYEKNDNRLKGTIDISRHIKLNAGLKNGRIAYSYRERTSDNYFNYLLLITYHKLKRQYPGVVNTIIDGNREIASFLSLLRNEIEYEDKTLSDVIKRNLKPISHPYFYNYEKIRRTCLKILRDEKTALFCGESNNEVVGVLYYIPDLWEKFIEDQIFKVREVKAQESRSYGTSLFRTISRPDFLLKNGNNRNVVLDAKFRPEWSDIFINSTSDMRLPEGSLSDYEKCIRDMNVFAADGTGVIFPYIDNNDYNSLNGRKIQEIDNIGRKFYLFPVCIPKNQGDISYDEWREQFEKRLEVFREDMTGI